MIDQIAHVAGLSALVSLGNPLELVKSRIQIMNQLIDSGSLQKRYQGIIDCARAIKINEGIKSFWKGNSISIVRFFANENINNDTKNMAKGMLPTSTISNFVAGIIGGWTAASILYPIDTVRFFIATSIQKTTQTIRNLSQKVKHEGTKYLFKGFGGSFLNIALFRGTYYGIFETFKQKTTSNWEKWTVAYLSGLCAGLVVYPTQTIRKKKIISNKSDGYSAIILKTIRREGICGFYRGCILTPFQSLCGAAVLIYFDSQQRSQ